MGGAASAPPTTDAVRAVSATAPAQRNIIDDGNSVVGG
jgi:hypothetical protein